MRRKKPSKQTIDAAVKDIIKDELADLSPSSTDDFTDEELEQIPRSLESDEDEEIINRLLQSFPSTEGFYGKLYRKASNGKLEFKHHLDMLEDIEDPELEILNLIRDRGWEDGDYMLRVFKRGHPDCKKTISWRMAAQSRIPNAPHQEESLQNKLSEIKGIISAVKDVTSAPNIQPADTTKAITDAFKSGVEAIRTTIPVAQNEQDLSKTIQIFKDLGLIKEEKPLDILQILTVLKELNKTEKAPDIWQEILKLRELGIIKLSSEAAEKDDTFSSIEKITSLIEMMKPLMGITSETSKPSIAIKLIEILGPQIPKIVENITSAVGKIADVSKMKLSSRLGVTESPRLHPSPILEAPSTMEQPNLFPEQPILENKLVGEKPMNPIVKEIYDAVQSNNHNFFPKLKEMMTLYVGPHIFEVLISKQITIDSFLQSLTSMLQADFLLEENTKKYFESFLSWIVGNTITAKCDACGEIFDFESEEMFNQDSKICDCGGALVKIETQLVGTA